VQKQITAVLDHQFEPFGGQGAIPADPLLAILELER
jgi:hypothetical protein